MDIIFTPVYGVGEDEPLCYQLEVNNIVILIDCGWNLDFDPATIEPLRRCVQIAVNPEQLICFFLPRA